MKEPFYSICARVCERGGGIVLALRHLFFFQRYRPFTLVNRMLRHLDNGRLLGINLNDISPHSPLLLSI